MVIQTASRSREARAVDSSKEQILVRVNLGDRSYDVVVSTGDQAGLGTFARQRVRGTLAFLITDENARAHADVARESLTIAGFQAGVAVVPPGEATKSLT